MNVFNCIKDEIKFNKMCLELNHHETNHSEEYYYEIRNKDKDKNKFNVPFGKKTKVNTYEGQNLGIILSYLNFNDIKILSIDFEESVKDVKKEILFILISHMIQKHLHLIVIQKIDLEKKNKKD